MEKHKKNKAAALKYDSSHKAPVITALGIGEIADRIVNEAYKNNVPVVRDDELVELLQNVDIGEYIPSELYEAVAKVIAYVVDIDCRITEKRSKK